MRKGGTGERCVVAGEDGVSFLELLVGSVKPLQILYHTYCIVTITFLIRFGRSVYSPLDQNWSKNWSHRRRPGHSESSNSRQSCRRLKRRFITDTFKGEGRR